jgi:beta-glucuronidase
LKKALNFVDSIHNESYEHPYLSKSITHQTMIYDNGREKESLNGFWNFGIDQYDTCLRAKWYEENYVDDDGRTNPMDFSFDLWEKITVPSSWNTQNERFFLYEGSAVYTRTFLYTNHGEERVFIKFGAVNYDAKIFLNREYLGFHKGGSTPFFIEVTGGFLKASNRIIVVANNTRKRSNVPTENTDWFNYGGIYRDVELIRLPGTFIKDFVIGLVPGSEFSKIKVELSVDGLELEDSGVLTIDELGITCPIKVTSGKGSVELDALPELWKIRSYMRSSLLIGTT